MLHRVGWCPFPSRFQGRSSTADGLVSGVLQSHLESYFRALVLFGEARERHFKDPFAVEADVSQTAWDTKPFLHV